MPEPPRTVVVVVKAEVSSQFGAMLDIYRKINIHWKTKISASFSFHLGFAAILTTLIVCGITLLHLTIQQQSMIMQMQKSLYLICLRSLAGQVVDNSDSQSNDGGVENGN